ncbi:MAG: T6SS phospholipase effector Tle1-like catalytic domain-containing protein [Phycisphaerales bacterium]
MVKTIVICCDGTGNTFGRYHTNVYKMCRVLAHDGTNQLVYYDPGVGTLGDTGGLSKLRSGLLRVLGGAVGYGLKQNVASAYAFLSLHHRPGDRIAMFGFSRGAYTIRLIAALVRSYGLSPPGATNLPPHLVELLTADDRDDPNSARGSPLNRFEVAGSFKKYLGREAKIDFVGLFDSVNAVGWLWNPLRPPPYSANNSAVRVLRHAVAIDERRGFFLNEPTRRASRQDHQELWFAGVHSDVGGGYPHDEQQLAQVAFEWMLKEARACRAEDGSPVLAFREEAQDDREGVSEAKYAAPDAAGMMHDSMNWAWSLAEFLPRFVGWRRRVRARKDGEKPRWKLQFPLKVNIFRSRTVPENAVFHESVYLRAKALGEEYRPRNCPDLVALAAADPSRFRA